MIGVDAVFVPDFRSQLADAASGFAAGTFTRAELALAAARPGGDPVPHLAARFAAKEAFLKAWEGMFWGRKPPLERVDLRDIEVVSDAWGRPSLALHGAVAAALGTHLVARVSLSHDGPMAIAFVALTGVEESPR